MEVKVCSHLEPPAPSLPLVSPWESVRLGVFLQLRGSFAGVLFPTPLHFLPDPFALWQRRIRHTPWETPLTQSWTVSGGRDRGWNTRHTFSKIRARKQQRLTNVICPEVLCLGGPIISNQPHISLCMGVCRCLCECADRWLWNIRNAGQRLCISFTKQFWKRLICICKEKMKKLTHRSQLMPLLLCSSSK